MFPVVVVSLCCKLKVSSLSGPSLKWQEQSAEQNKMSVISLNTAMEAVPTAQMMFTSWMVTHAATARLIATTECARALIHSVNLYMGKVWFSFNVNPFVVSWQTLPVFLFPMFFRQCSGLLRFTVFCTGARKAPDICFEKANIKGDRFGNCGMKGGVYKKCPVQ